MSQSATWTVLHPLFGTCLVPCCLNGQVTSFLRYKGAGSSITGDCTDATLR
jgi:hypothetical protein